VFSKFDFTADKTIHLKKNKDDKITTTNAKPKDYKKLLKKLQDIEKKQEACKKKLSEFMDSKRRQFPRFYFMSEADLLDLLSNSSEPGKVLAQIERVLLSTKELTLESQTINKSTVEWRATHFIASVGKERVPFNPPVFINGKVETYLHLILKAQQATLSL
jgi:dynein heavy chain